MSASEVVTFTGNYEGAQIKMDSPDLAQFNHNFFQIMRPDLSEQETVLALKERLLREQIYSNPNLLYEIHQLFSVMKNRGS